MKKTFLLSLCFIALNSLQAKNELDSLLKELDRKIEENATYIKIKEDRIEDLKKENRRPNRSPSLTYSINTSLYQEYKSYTSDSAIHYLNRNLDMAYAANDIDKINETSIHMVSLFASLGMYKEGLDIMSNVDKRRLDRPHLIEYYLTIQNIYSGLGLYTQNSRERWKYWQQSTAYKDTIISLVEYESEDYLRFSEKTQRETGMLDEAIKSNDKRLEQIKTGTPGYALVTFERSLLYRKKGNTEKEKEYLILSAISDIQSAIKDNASIPILANILMKEGDLNRAYKYVRFSLNNINDYNTRIRSSEILNIQSIIDKAYQAKNEEQKRTLRIFLILISVLSVLLTLLICYIYRQMKKGLVISKRLKETNKELKELNQKLQKLNSEHKKINLEIVEANYVKEEYISYFLDECSKYIDKMDEYRKMVNKKIQDNQVDKLYRITRDNTLKSEELKELFQNFDIMFIRIFPDFIEKFNALLMDEEQIVLKKGEVLNTELRIYALIRLGITDNTRIANFLSYSVNTIYNYRAKIRNKAKIAREDFEWTVRRIGSYS